MRIRVLGVEALKMPWKMFMIAVVVRLGLVMRRYSFTDATKPRQRIVEVLAAGTRRINSARRGG